MRGVDFKTQLKKISADVGFSSVAITDPENIEDSTKERFNEFVENNWNADMDWLEKRIDERVTPKKLWPSVKSVLVFTDDYTPEKNPLRKLKYTEMANLSVFVSKRDYHKVVKTKLKLVAAWIKNIDCDLKIFVDSSGNRKPLAQLSGLGWQGKHTNLVSKKWEIGSLSV